MAKQLTTKQAKFVKAKAEGKTGTEAAMIAYDVKDATVASSIAAENLKKPSIQEVLQAELSKQGITIEKIVRPVARALDNESIELQLKGHDRAIKLLGFQQKSDNGTSVNINFNQHIQDQREKYGL